MHVATRLIHLYLMYPRTICFVYSPVPPGRQLCLLWQLASHYTTGHPKYPHILYPMPDALKRGTWTRPSSSGEDDAGMLVALVSVESVQFLASVWESDHPLSRYARNKVVMPCLRAQAVEKSTENTPARRCRHGTQCMQSQP